jgi:5-methylcytosine-specific restriction endonuclease McrA
MAVVEQAEQAKGCTICGEVKPLSAFANDRSKCDGLRTPCRVCDGRSRRRERSTEWLRLSADGLKRCSTCKQVQPVTNFGSHKERRDGLACRCRECQRAASHASYERNREAVIESARRYREEHPGAGREAHRRRYQELREENPELLRKQRRDWKRANPDKVRASEREYERRRRAEHPEEVRAEAREKYRANPAPAKYATRQRKALKKAAAGDCTLAQWDSRWAMRGRRCYLCGRPAKTMDHVKPLSKGGSHWPSNLRPCCNSCNSRKKDHWDGPSAYPANLPGPNHPLPS